MLFRQSPQGARTNPDNVGQRFEPNLGNGAEQGTRSSGAWPGDLAHISPDKFAEREEDWIEPAQPRRGGLPPEEMHAASHYATEPYESLWEGTSPEPPVDEELLAEGKPRENRWQQHTDIFESLRREPARDEDMDVDVDDQDPQRD
jgi:hypothetical protein